MIPAEPGKRYDLRKDKYSKARGGKSVFLNIFCSSCGCHLALYQKDGQGALLRLYLDRIFAPAELAQLQLINRGKGTVPNLECPKCRALIGIPMVYQPEGRLAIRLQRGSIAKRVCEPAVGGHEWR